MKYEYLAGLIEKSQTALSTTKLTLGRISEITLLALSSCIKVPIKSAQYSIDTETGKYVTYTSLIDKGVINDDNIDHIINELELTLLNLQNK